MAMFPRVLLCCGFWLALCLIGFGQDLRWAPLYEPGVGGAITSISIKPTDGKVILVGGDILGAGRSIDGGVTWDQSLSGIASYEIEEFTWHPTNADTVWVGTGNGPFVSTDSGKNWSSRRTGMPSATAESNSFTASVQKILVTPGNPSRLLAVFGTKRNHAGGALKNSGHVYVSNDSGTGWSKLSEIIPGVVDNSANVHTAAYTSEPLSTTILAVVSNHGVFKSTDSGETWSAANGGLPAESDGQVAADHLAVSTRCKHRLGQHGSRERCL